MNKRIVITRPLLPGSISTAKSQCGKPNCACKRKPPALHGTYYRWTGLIKGKRTTKTISNKTALECKKRIRNYRKLQQDIKRMIAEDLADAPWVNPLNK